MGKRALRSALRWSSLILSVLGAGCEHPAGLRSTPLRDLAEGRHFAIGAAVAMNAYRTDPMYRRKLAAEYNSVVAEGAMKFGPIHPSPTQYAFADADELVAFAQANRMAIHGHTLVWHYALPTWITGGTFTKPQLLAVLQDHITTVVGRYRGKIATWDVVNEVVADDGGSLRNTIWLQVIGPEYIDSAFVWAQRADPAARLYLNDTRAEWLNTKSDTILSLVQQLRARGIRLDGVGFQAHFTTTPPAASSIQANLARFAAAGFDVRISEMDVRIADTAGPSELVQQATVYHDVLDACLRVARCVGFTTWGFTDQYSWIPAYMPGFGRALPLDASYNAKPAYDALLARLEEP